MNHFTCHQILRKIKLRKLLDVEHQRHLAVVEPLAEVVVVAVAHQGRADREENRVLRKKFQIRISTFEKLSGILKKNIYVLEWQILRIRRSRISRDQPKVVDRVSAHLATEMNLKLNR